MGRRALAQRDRGLCLEAALQARAIGNPHPHRARLRLHAGRVQGAFAIGMRARSLRAQLLRMLLPPIAALLALGAALAYHAAREPTTEAYDQALVDIGIALGAHIQAAQGDYRFELPAAVEKMVRTDRYDRIYYRVLGPNGKDIAGDVRVPASDADGASYNGVVNGQNVRVVRVETECERATCTVLVAETTNKRARAAREFLLTSLLPGILIALATMLIVWFGVKRGLWPLARLSDELKARSPHDLRPIDAAAAPDETRPLVSALNGLLEELAQGAQNQQRFLANAAHQLRTPLAGLQAHTELALAQPMPQACRAHLEQVHKATIRTARLANQLLALARAEPGARSLMATLDLKNIAGGEAEAWVRQSLARDIDLGFEL